MLGVACKLWLIIVHDHPTAGAKVLCVFRFAMYVLLPIVTPLAALQVTCTKSYADRMRQVTAIELDDDERMVCGCEEPEHETGEDQPDAVSEICPALSPCDSHDSQRKHNAVAIVRECRDKLKRDEEHLRRRIEWLGVRVFALSLLAAFTSFLLKSTGHDLHFRHGEKSFFTPFVVCCTCVVFGASTVPLAAMMQFAELKIIAHRKYVCKILEPRGIDNSGTDAPGHWAKCASKYLRLSTDLEDQAKETKWLFLSMHGSFAMFLGYNGLLLWSTRSVKGEVWSMVMTCLIMAVWFAYLLAYSRVTTSATDDVTNVVLAYIRSIESDSSKASTTGVNVFLVILEKHPTGCYLFPFFGTKQVLSPGVMAKILAAPLANVVIRGAQGLLSWIHDEDED
jgi:hypothetical protein